jgi:hypothetical protein
VGSMANKKLIYCPDCNNFSTVNNEEELHADDIYLKSGNEMFKIISYAHCKKCNKLIPMELDVDEKFEF